jgi:hypothetical protein
MNADDFEQQLQRQPMRAVPPAWRQQILTGVSAQRAARGPVPETEASWWRALLWPCPQAWAGVAAVWLLILGLHGMSGFEPRSPAQLATVMPSAEWRALLAEQRRLFTELLFSPEPPPAPSRSDPADRPRSQGPQGSGSSAGWFLQPTRNHSLT